jgi:moderate conductance mechanosensitive channel
MIELEQWFADPAIWTGIAAVGVHLLILLVATAIALRFSTVTIRASLGRLFAREVEEGTARDADAVEVVRRRETLERLLDRALKIIILAIAFLMGLAILRLDIGPAIAGLGILGLAVSLGAQNLVKDYVAGAFVFVENQYAKGDVVSVAGLTGAVEDVNLRRVTLRDIDGTLHFVPHGLVETSSNLTRTWANINLDLPISYGVDLDALRELIDDAGRSLADDPEWRERVLQAPAMLRVERLGDFGMVVKVLGTVRALDRFAAAGEMRRRILDGALQAGIKIGLGGSPMQPPPAEGGKR